MKAEHTCNEPLTDLEIINDTFEKLKELKESGSGIMTPESLMPMITSIVTERILHRELGCAAYKKIKPGMWNMYEAVLKLYEEYEK